MYFPLDTFSSSFSSFLLDQDHLSFPSSSSSLSTSSSLLLLPLSVSLLVCVCRSSSFFFCDYLTCSAFRALCSAWALASMASACSFLVSEFLSSTCFIRTWTRRPSSWTVWSWWSKSSWDSSISCFLWCKENFASSNVSSSRRALRLAERKKQRERERNRETKICTNIDTWLDK